VAASARGLATHVYDVTDSFPRDERFGLTAQMRRASVSIGANIAEGAGRYTNKEFASFLQIAMGSACELEFEALVARDLGFLSEAAHEDLEKRLVGAKRELGALLARVRGLDPRSALNQVDETTKPATKNAR
jgi:four helix bundle protein